MHASHVAPRRARNTLVLASLGVLVGAAACGGTPPSESDAPAASAAACRERPARGERIDRSGRDPDASTGGGRGRCRHVPGRRVAVVGRRLHRDGPRRVGSVQYGQHPPRAHATPTTSWDSSPSSSTTSGPKACAGSGSGAVEVGASVDDLVAALLEQEGPDKSDPVATTLGGYEGTRIDMTVPEGFDLHPCNAQDIGLQVWYSEPADENVVLLRRCRRERLRPRRGRPAAGVPHADRGRGVRCRPRRAPGRPRLDPDRAVGSLTS